MTQSICENMELQRGITGFYHYTEAPPPEVEYKVFKTACYEVARVCNYSALAHSTPSYERSFFSFEVTSRERKIWIICNRYYPVISFVEPILDGNIELAHTDCAELVNEFTSRGDHWILMDSSTAAQPATPESLTHLGSAEINQTKYWKPKTISQIVFNFWD